MKLFQFNHKNYHLHIIFISIFLTFINTSPWTFLKGSKTFDSETSSFGSPRSFSESNLPGCRQSTSLVPVDKSIYFFGGYMYPLYISEIWVYDIKNNIFSYLKGEVNNGPIWNDYEIGQYNSSHLPPGTLGQGSVLSHTKETIFVIGGTNSDYGGLNYFFEYNIATNDYRYLFGALDDGEGTHDQDGVYTAAKGQYHDPVDALFAGRYLFQYWSIDEIIYIFSGCTHYNNRESVNDMWGYDMDKNQLAWLDGPQGVNIAGVTGTVNTYSEETLPRGRRSAVTWVVEDELYMFGGAKLMDGGGNYHYNDFFMYSTVLNQWKWIGGDANSDQTSRIKAVVDNPKGFSLKNYPSAAAWRSGGKIGNYAFIFGGQLPEEATDFRSAVWMYDIALNQFKLFYGDVNDKNTQNDYTTPAMGGTSRSGYVSHLGVIFIHGGNQENTAGGNDRDDLWALSFPECFGLISSDRKVCSGKGSCEIVDGMSQCLCKKGNIGEDCSESTLSGFMEYWYIWMILLAMIVLCLVFTVVIAFVVFVKVSGQKIGEIRESGGSELKNFGRSKQPLLKKKVSKVPSRRNKSPKRSVSPKRVSQRGVPTGIQLPQPKRMSGRGTPPNRKSGRGTSSNRKSGRGISNRMSGRGTPPNRMSGRGTPPNRMSGRSTSSNRKSGRGTPPKKVSQRGNQPPSYNSKEPGVNPPDYGAPKRISQTSNRARQYASTNFGRNERVFVRSRPPVGKNIKTTTKRSDIKGLNRIPTLRKNLPRPRKKPPPKAPKIKAYKNVIKQSNIKVGRSFTTDDMNRRSQRFELNRDEIFKNFQNDYDKHVPKKPVPRTSGRMMQSMRFQNKKKRIVKEKRSSFDGSNIADQIESVKSKRVQGHKDKISFFVKALKEKVVGKEKPKEKISIAEWKRKFNIPDSAPRKVKTGTPEFDEEEARKHKITIDMWLRVHNIGDNLFNDELDFDEIDKREIRKAEQEKQDRIENYRKMLKRKISQTDFSQKQFLTNK